MIKRFLLKSIDLYQYFFSPLRLPSCRFYPSCSHYAAEAIMKYGSVKGGWLSIKRVIRCNPWSAGGFDPVP